MRLSTSACSASLLALLLAGALVLAGCDSGSDPSDDLGNATTYSFANGDGGTVAENAGDTYELTVVVDDPGFQELSVDVVFDEGNSGVSFDEISGIERTTTLTFSESTTDSTTRTLSFQVEDDDEIGEMAEDVVFTLANAQNGEIGANGSFTLTVNDDDLTAIDIADARAMDDGEVVAVEGVVTRIEGSNARIQDGTAGIVVRSSDLADALDSGDVSLGDRIRAMGPLGAFNGLRQLSGDDVRYMVIEEDAGLPDAQDFELDEIGEDDESELVTVDGLSLQTDETAFASDGGDGFGNYTLVDEDGNASDVVLRIPSDSYYAGESIPQGTFTFVGVVGERNGTYKLVAIQEDDLTDIEQVGPSVLTIAEARETEGEEVTIEGVVTTAGTDEGRVQDETAGIYISRNEDFGSGVMRGDRVRITGIVNGYANQRQIDQDNLISYEVLSSGNALPEAQMLSSLADLDDEVESERVRVEGLTISADGGDDGEEPDDTFMAGGAEGNYTITDGDGNEAILRIPSGSFYEGEPIPSSPVTIEAVAGQFFEDFQLLARYEGQIGAGGGGDSSTLLSENFDDESLDPFTAFSVSSNEDWEISTFDGATFARVSGFEADEASNDWLISPALDFSATSDEVLAFTTAKGYEGPELDVLVSTNYDGEGNPEEADWTDITDRVTLAQNSDKDGSFTPFISSGDVDVSDFDGEAVYIAFQYDAQPDNAATWEVDDVVVAEGSATGGGGFPEPPGRPSN